MQFSYDLNLILEGDSNNIAKITSSSLPRVDSISQNYNPKISFQEKMADLLDTIGRASAEAQGLTNPITSFQKIANSTHRLYLKFENNKVIGFIKVGEKSLSYRHFNGKFSEITPLAVLDFFVHPTCQRRGSGKELFECMLAYESTEARKLAFDRPSFKFKAFLARHYGLDQYITQINHFVVFNQYFVEPTNQNLPENLNSKKLTPLIVPDLKVHSEPMIALQAKP